MRFFEYNYKTFNGDEKTLRLRLVSNDMKTIEKKAQMSLLDYISNPTITMITTILMYMNRPAQSNYSMAEAEALYDELVDADLTLEEIYEDIIMETLVISGFMKKEDLEKMKTKTKELGEEQMEQALTPSKKNN